MSTYTAEQIAADQADYDAAMIRLQDAQNRQFDAVGNELAQADRDEQSALTYLRRFEGCEYINFK